MTNPIPAHAIHCWCDSASIYLAIPAPKLPDGHYVMSYPLSTGGLQKAIDFMQSAHAKAGHPATTRTALPPSAMLNSTTTQRKTAWEALRAIGLV